jgi:hypothetical protein
LKKIENTNIYWQADDGVQFDSEDACSEYEKHPPVFVIASVSHRDCITVKGVYGDYAKAYFVLSTLETGVWNIYSSRLTK